MGRNPKFHSLLPHSFDEVLNAIANENKPAVKTTTARPFLKWVGGKRSILPELIKRLPKEYNAYCEPFLGGGALYFALKPDRAYLSDINFHLILTFQAVKDDPKLLIHYLKIHERNHNKEYYYKARVRLFKERDKVRIAGLFIYLNKTCFNGLYRVNSQGGFNVPMGDYKNPLIVDEKNLMEVSRVLQTADIKQQDFLQIKPQRNDFYYLDPPYHETYDGYNGKGFGDNEHIKLSEFCKVIDKKGGYFMLSNSDTELVRSLYKGYNIEKVLASRSVSCKAHQRGKENELIIRNYK